MPDFDTSSGAENQLPANALTDTNTKTVTNKSLSGSTNTITNIPDSALLQITDKAKLEADIFYKDSNNDLGTHYFDIEHIAEPAAPATNKSRIYRDSSDGVMKTKNSTGGVTSLQGGGASALSGLSDLQLITVSNGQYLQYDNSISKWKNVTATPVGEANTASNIGTAGTGLFKQKSVLDLQFYKLNAGSSKLTINLDSPNNKIDLDIASNVTTNDNTQTFTNKTIDVNTTNLIRHSTTNVAGDLLKGNGTSYQRFGKGAANLFLRVNAAGTDLEWATAGAGDVLTTSPNTYGDFDQVFRSGRLDLRNPANTFSYNITGSAIVSDRNIILPLLTGNDTVVCEANTATLTNKALTSPTITSPSMTTINNGGTMTLPSGTDTIVARNSTDTITNKTINATNNSITDSSQAAGDILKGNGTKFVRMARGSALQVLRVNTGGTDLEYASLESERIGKHQASGNGSTSIFTIAHGLGSTPTYVFISVAKCGTTTKPAPDYTFDGTNITLTFGSPPESGTNNVIVHWRVVA